MSIKEHQERGYDRAVSMFSPDGYLLQVEYAEKAVNLGATSLVISYKDGILFVCDRKIKSKLLVKESFKKVFEIDSTLFVCGSGVMSDGRRLIEQAQDCAKEFRVKFESQIDVISIVKDIANIQQYYSQSGGIRPFGVSLIFGSIENGESKIYQTTPSGVYMRYKGVSAGQDSSAINEKLEEVYRDNLSLDEAKKLCINLLREVKEKNFSHKDLEIKYLNKDGISDLSEN